MLLTNDCILQSAGRYLLIMPTNKQVEIQSSEMKHRCQELTIYL